MRSLLKRYQIVFYFALTLLIGWLPWYTGRGSLFIFAPTLAALIMAVLVDGTDGVLEVLRRIVRWRANLWWYLVALLSPAVLYCVTVGIHVLLGGDAPGFPMFRENQHLLVLTFVFFLLPWQSSAFLEEVGFRGYALEELQNKVGPMVGTLILGAFFGAWLLPEFFQADTAQAAMGGVGFYPWFILTEIGWSVLMTWVYNNTNKSSLIAGYLFHTAFNFWPMVLLTNAIPGQPMPQFDTTLFAIAALVVALAAVLLLIRTKGQLGFQPGEASDAD
jgi:membrane protease YdiL (CAAX protease family)